MKEESLWRKCFIVVSVYEEFDIYFQLSLILALYQLHVVFKNIYENLKDMQTLGRIRK